MTTTASFRGSTTAACGIIGHATCAARLGEIAALRDRGGPAGSPALPARFLRHADEQTVLGMHAVLAAIAATPAAHRDRARQAVVSAACLSGRIAAARTLRQFHAQGAGGVSPHVVPQCSLHSVAGAVSVALGMHGPHLGVGGGSDALAEGLLAALSLVRTGAGSGGTLPGVWLVATAWDEEPVLDDATEPVNDPVCRSLAMFVVPDAAVDEAALTIEWLADVAEPVDATPTSLADFARALEMCHDGTALVSWSIACPWTGRIRVARRDVAASAPHSGRPVWWEAA